MASTPSPPSPLPARERGATGLPLPARERLGEGEAIRKQPWSNEKLSRIHPIIRQRARELRQPQTSAEEQLWQHLRRKQLKGYYFRRQHPIGNFIVDFYCAEVRLVIEVDGDIHAFQEQYDAARTE